jgi:hypothetical protein
VQEEIAQVVDDCRSALTLAERMEWKSFDPFDLLLSPPFEWVRRRLVFAGRVIVQIGRRSGPGVRRFVGVRPHEEAKSTADLLHACALLAPEPWARDAIDPLAERLRRLAIPTPHGHAWGLGFPWASRFVSVPSGAPNAYTTISAVAALTRAGDDRHLELARAGAAFISEDLGVVSDGSASWFRYWPNDDSWIVNVQALLAASFQELARLTGAEKLASHAALAARAALRAQRPDGSFPYSMDPRGQFMDAFHTGFVLEGLTRFRQSGGDLADARLDEAIDRGMAFFRSRLVDGEGRPLKAPGGEPVRDGQNVGQLIQTLVVCGNDVDRRQAVEIWRSYRTQPWLRAPEAAAQSGTVSLRWDVAPVALALAHLAVALSRET